MLVPGEEPLPSQGAGRDPPCLSEEVAEPLENKDGLQEVEREGILRSSLDGTETVQDNSFLQQLQPQQCGPITAKFGSLRQHRGRERDTPGRDSGKGYTGALEEALSKMNISCRFLQETVETLLSK
uniref:Uncharacterized protein n=1 Tax=Chromera velia CCMP2878 TaxID=1169474 RepID=A0A0G4I7C4_9ALVE|eukprot:Cvel_36510.t1-p1 / transcript=Cvel_36510.t1 / gene=Cvel_36510 / organism=Chromera_velia_CCMP2878 / gene_product=hypothetical protein / transcript_product=hypothetical protein / location=Cvel_scaffold7370:197-571(-) / protein_length=125 / sequence_SO=supercontig / SO=protein_coding / is_pseudo=false